MNVIPILKNYVLLINLVSTFLFGAYLNNISVVLVQPDNSELHCFTSGDEYYSWLHDENGNPIIQSQLDGFYYYGERLGDILVPTLNRADNNLPRNQNIENWSGITRENYLNRRERYWSGFELYDAPSIGTINNINIFIRFNDENEFRNDCTDFDDPFNKIDGPSLGHYYDEVSYGLLEVITHHFPACGSDELSYKDAFPRSYYQPYNAANNTNGYLDCWNINDTTDAGFSCENSTQWGYIREHILLKNAIESIKEQIPSDLDVDGNDDLMVDNVTFLVSGSPTGWSDLLWPHRWSLTTYDVEINGSIVDAYNLNLLSGNPSYFTVGTLCHEFFHSLGAPDLYHYVESATPTPVGAWDIMEKSSDIPQYMSAWMKYRYANWLDCTLIESGGTYALKPLQNQENSCYIIKSPYSESQFFTVEYRKQEGIYESNLPGNEDGLLVYRINLDINNNGILDNVEVDESWNKIIGGNADGPPDEVYLYRPGGTSILNGNLLEALYNYESGRIQLNDGTDPSSFLVEPFIDENENGIYDIGEDYTDVNGDGNYGDMAGGLHLKNIGEAGDSIQFEFVKFFLNIELTGISEDDDSDGVLNPGESAKIRFSTQIFGNANQLSNIKAELSSEDEIVSFSPRELTLDFMDEDSDNLNFESILSFENVDELNPVQFDVTVSAEFQENENIFSYSDKQQFSLDVSLNQAGFPLQTTQIRSSPLIIDFDNDGDKEIIFGDYNGIIHIINNDGTELNTTVFPFDTGDAIWSSPAAADLDGNGTLEFVITSKSKHLYIFENGLLKVDFNTELYDTDSTAVGIYLIGTPAIGNLDDDAELEIVFTGYSNNNKLFVINHDGSLVDGFPIILGEKMKNGVALADFNNNGKDDIVFGTDNNHLYLIFDDGSIADGFPYIGTDKFQSAPSILDFNGEKIIAAGNLNDTLYVINKAGSLLFYYPTEGKILTSPIFISVANEPYLIFSSNDNFIYFIDLNGNSYPGWPIQVERNLNGSVTASDLNGDGKPEIAVTTELGEIIAYHLDGTIFRHFPIKVDYPFSTAPIFNDIDLDGDLELIAGSRGSIEVIDIKEQGNFSNYWSTYRGNTKRNGLFIFEIDLSLSEKAVVPTNFKIKSAYPNPFNPIINIQYQTPFQSHITLEIIDIKGRLITRLVNKIHSPGAYDIHWNAGGYSSGIYFLQYILMGDKLPASQRIQNEKIVLLK
jgi:M6 family metalloprotease-like protein